MSKVVKGARFISKISEVSGIEPTIPPNDDHTLGWRDTDIYVGEWFWNVTDSKIFYRDNTGIGRIVTPDPTTGKIDSTLLPGNYLGAMVYRGVWNASTGQAPGISIGRLTPEKGDYYIVNVSGNTNLDNITDWKVGDYPVYNGSDWDKIDNSEPTLSANNILYDNSTYTSLNNVDRALEKIFDEKFITPQFDDTVTINLTTFGIEKTALQINDTIDNKWINWNNSTLSMGSNDSSNSILNIGPNPNSSAAYTSTLNLHWANNSPVEERLRWKMYSSNTDGYIQGYANDGSTINTKISSVSDSYFLQGNFGIGTTPSGVYKLEVNGSFKSGDITSTGSIIGDSYFRSSDNAVVLGTASSGTVFIRPFLYNNATDQSTFTQSGATIGTNMTVNGQGIINQTTSGIAALKVLKPIEDSSNTPALIVANDGDVSDVIAEFRGNSIASNVDISDTPGSPDAKFTIYGQGNVTATGTLTANSLVASSLDINGTSSLSGKASYDNYASIAITSLNDLTHKAYVDNEIASHAVGLWSIGSTNLTSSKDIVVYSGTAIYKVGINKYNPTYDLDVVGNALITSSLDVNGTLNSNGPLVVDGITTINSAMVVNSNTYLYGNLEVENTVDLATDGISQIILRGGTVTVANSGNSDSDAITLRFDGANTYGAQKIAIESINSSTDGRLLTISGQKNNGTGDGGDLNIYGGQSLGGNGGGIYIKGGNSNNFNNGGDVHIAGGDSSSGEEGSIYLDSMIKEQTIDYITMGTYTLDPKYKHINVSITGSGVQSVTFDLSNYENNYNNNNNIIYIRYLFNIIGGGSANIYINSSPSVNIFTRVEGTGSTTTFGGLIGLYYACNVGSTGGKWYVIINDETLG